MFWSDLDAIFGEAKSAHQGVFTIVEFNFRGRVIFLVSIYGIAHNSESIGNLRQSVNEIVRATYGRDALVAGDINTPRGYSIKPARVARERSDQMFKYLERFGNRCIGPFGQPGGLPGCPCGHDESCDHIQTYRQDKKRSTPFQLDYAFASRELLRHRVHCQVLDRPSPWSDCDHLSIEIVIQ